MTVVADTARRALLAAAGPEGYARVSAAVRDCQSASQYRISLRGLESRRRIRELRDAHAGERCFIVGNGPSVNEQDLGRLEPERIFLLNRGYLLRDRIGRDGDYVVAVNRHVLHQFGDEILGLESTKFVAWHARRLFDATDRVLFVRSRARPAFYGTSADLGVWEGSTVTFVALQLAFYFGFSEVVLIGVDHQFTDVGRPHEAAIAAGDDPNHFDPLYFGPGTTWQYPDLVTSERAYRLALEAYTSARRRVVNATAGGRLEVFPRVRYEDLL